MPRASPESSRPRFKQSLGYRGGGGSESQGGENLVIGGNGKEECYYIRDADGDVKVDIQYVEDNIDWYVYIGTASVAGERRSYFALRADLP